MLSNSLEEHQIVAVGLMSVEFFTPQPFRLSSRLVGAFSKHVGVTFLFANSRFLLLSNFLLASTFHTRSYRWVLSHIMRISLVSVRKPIIIPRLPFKPST